MTYKRKAGLSGALLTALAVGFVVASGASGRVNHRALAVEVHVTFTDKSLTVAPGSLNSQLASFDIALVVVNKGTKPHLLTIKGPGLSGAPTKQGTWSQRVAPRTTTTLRLKLLTGAYQFSDPRGLATGTEKWLVVHPVTVGNAGSNTKGSSVTNPAFPPGATSTNSGMACDI
jgi:hypothetical protein